jgi:transposase
VSAHVGAERKGCETAETKAARKPWEVEDGLWERIEPLLPVVVRNCRHPGCKRLDNRKVLCGILFVLYTGIRWEFLPQELGFGSGMTCCRRLRDWNDAGVWQRLHEVLLAELRAADLLDFSRAAVDGSHLRAMKGRAKTGPSPVDRGKTGSKHHAIVEAHGIPLAATLTGGNRNDVTELIPLIQAVCRRSGASAVDPAGARRRSTPIAATTTTNTATRSAHWASPRSSPGAEPNTAPAWASIAGWSRQLLRCCTGSAACASAGRSATTSTKRSSPSAAPSSAGDV